MQTYLHVAVLELNDAPSKLGEGVGCGKAELEVGAPGLVEASTEVFSLRAFAVQAGIASPGQPLHTTRDLSLEAAESAVFHLPSCDSVFHGAEHHTAGCNAVQCVEGGCCWGFLTHLERKLAGPLGVIENVRLVQRLCIVVGALHDWREGSGDCHVAQAPIVGVVVAAGISLLADLAVVCARVVDA